MVVSPRCLERGPSSTPSHHQCEGRPPPKTTARRAPSNSAVASAVGLGGLGARYPIYGSAVIARSDSDDPSTLAAQATPGWESAEALCAKAEAIQLACCGKAGLLRFARNDGGKTRALILTARFHLSFVISFAPLRREGAGKAGRWMHP